MKIVVLPFLEEEKLARLLRAQFQNVAVQILEYVSCFFSFKQQHPEVTWAQVPQLE